MSNFEIHELTEKAISRNSNIIHDTLYGEDYETGKNLAGAVADLASANVAAPYDETVTYAIGQYCLNEGNIYRCIAITTGAFDSTAWVQIVVTGEFRRVVEISSSAYAQLTSAEQNNGTLYVLTDEETTADDIPYTSGVSVADKLDSLKIIKTGKVYYSGLKGGGHADRVTVTVTFDSPMPNANYVAFAMVNDAYSDYPFIRIYPFQKTATGFTATCINSSGSTIAVNGQFDWVVIS